MWGCSIIGISIRHQCEIDTPCCGTRHPLRLSKQACVLPPVWGARYLPCRSIGCVSYRPRHMLMLRCICHWQRGATQPRPLAPLPFSATGGGRVTPPHPSALRAATFSPRRRRWIVRLTFCSINRHLKLGESGDEFPGDGVNGALQFLLGILQVLPDGK